MVLITQLNGGHPVSIFYLLTFKKVLDCKKNNLKEPLSTLKGYIPGFQPSHLNQPMPNITRST